jgi:hypothetical protein
MYPRLEREGGCRLSPEKWLNRLSQRSPCPPCPASTSNVHTLIHYTPARTDFDECSTGCVEQRVHLGQRARRDRAAHHRILTDDGWRTIDRHAQRSHGHLELGGALQRGGRLGRDGWPGPVGLYFGRWQIGMAVAQRHGAHRHHCGHCSWRRSPSGGLLDRRRFEFHAFTGPDDLSADTPTETKGRALFRQPDTKHQRELHVRLLLAPGARTDLVRQICSGTSA